MDTIRSTPSLRRLIGRAAAPAVLVLVAAACGGDDDDSAGGGGGSDSEFCQDMQSLDERFADSEDAAGAEMAEALDSLTELDPPDEIAQDWETVMGSLRGTAFDPSDEDAMQDIEEASARLDTYLEEECGISGT